MSILSVAEARQRILDQLHPVAADFLPLDASLDHVLAQDILASTDLPPFDNSSMDGFAIRSADIREDTITELRVVGDIAAGSVPSLVLGPGEAARIMTGAPLPASADAVVPVEDTDFQERSAGTAAPALIKIIKNTRRGSNIRVRGSDIKAGEAALPAHHTLRAQDIGLLAMLGQTHVNVYRKPRVALLSSGDELLPIEAPLEAGKIHDSNSPMLSALIKGAGAETITLGVAEDRFEAVSALLRQAAELQSDLILSSAGVSVGAFDFVKEVVDSDGHLDFWRVNMRPGKPLAFGQFRSIPFIGLPGNPVSAFVGFEVFVRPALLRLRGSLLTNRSTLRVRLGEDIKSDGRESYLRADVQFLPEGPVAFLSGHQGSANLPALVQANALLIIPAGVKSAPAGREAEAWLL